MTQVLIVKPVEQEVEGQKIFQVVDALNFSSGDFKEKYNKEEIDELEKMGVKIFESSLREQ